VLNRILRKITILVLVALFVFASNVPLSAYAIIGATQTGGCPTYLTNITVDLVNSNPILVTVGTEVTTQLHVVYPDGSPVTLMPETMSFLLNGTAGSKELLNQQVNYTGNPGFYNWTTTITSDIAQATLGASGTGTIYISVITCSCSDQLGNRGPTNYIGSIQTLTPSDNSNLNINPQTPMQQPVTYVVPLAIALLIIIGLFLFLLRSRRKKKQ
jgi:hypothetical protein